MIRRTMQRSLLTAIAVVALFPVAASATDGGSPATGAYTTPTRISAPGQHTQPPQMSTPGLSTAGRGHSHWHTGKPQTAKHGRHTVKKHRHATTAVHPKGRVTTRHMRLNVHSGPGTRYQTVSSVRHHGLVTIACKKKGTTVLGNNRWYKLAHRPGYVTARYVSNLGRVRWC